VGSLRYEGVVLVLCHNFISLENATVGFPSLDYQDCFLIASIMASSSFIVTRPSIC
jgi:hypothetical protein